MIKDLFEDLSFFGFIMIIIVFMGFIGGMGSLYWYKFAAPQYAETDRKVFEESKSYNHGVQSDLGKMYGEYLQADVTNKAIMKQIIITRFSEYNAENMENLKLKVFLIEMRGY